MTVLPCRQHLREHTVMAAYALHLPPMFDHSESYRDPEHMACSKSAYCLSQPSSKCMRQFAEMAYGLLSVALNLLSLHSHTFISKSPIILFSLQLQAPACSMDLKASAWHVISCQLHLLSWCQLHLQVKVTGAVIEIGVVVTAIGVGIGIEVLVTDIGDSTCCNSCDVLHLAKACNIGWSLSTDSSPASASQTTNMLPPHLQWCTSPLWLQCHRNKLQNKCGLIAAATQMQSVRISSTFRDLATMPFQ